MEGYSTLEAERTGRRVRQLSVRWEWEQNALSLALPFLSIGRFFTVARGEKTDKIFAEKEKRKCLRIFFQPLESSYI